ncbi:transposase [Haloimpatiens sp. FM7315]|uniref:transposase n=1 Tax=Haloimpatiens sp. FM7315 TaxID=3298609 RepID=UPI0035A3C352
MGVNESLVRRWVKEYGTHGKDAFPGKGKLRPEDEELRKMEEENAILKKAIRIFTKPEK